MIFLFAGWTIISALFIALILAGGGELVFYLILLFIFGVKLFPISSGPNAHGG